MSLDNFQKSISTLILVVLIVAALALALDAFRGDFDTSDICTNRDTGNTWFYNTTSDLCHNFSVNNGTSYAGSVAYVTTAEGLTGTTNASSYFSTIGTLIGVTALIAIVVAAFYMVRR